MGRRPGAVEALEGHEHAPRIRALTVLVTGGAGFIGSHVAEALVARGEDVRVLDDLSSGKRENLPEGVDFVEGDVREPQASSSRA